MKMWTF